MCQVLACNYTQGRGRQSGNVQLELRDAVTGNKANEKTSPDDIVDSAHASSSPPPLLPAKPARTIISKTAASPALRDCADMLFYSVRSRLCC
jgi:hypothetical protein